MAQRVSSSRFVGRREELGELERTLSGEDSLPALCFIAGESGVGKSRLLRELIGSAEDQGARAIGGACIELGADELPYAPLVAALRSLQRNYAPELERLSSSTRAELARLNPELGDPSTEPESERGEAQRRLFDAFLALIACLGEEHPVVFWIEDIHWADHSTRSFLRYLAASLGQERVAVIATYRADELHRRHPLRPLLAELERSALARRIELGRFDRDELSDQLADILGETPGEIVVERLYERSEGNPLFTEELLAAGIDGRGPLPPSLREALLVRVERLSETCRQLLRLLAVAGLADEELLAAANGFTAAGLSAALREAIDAQIVVRDGERFGFRHALLREVLYDDLLPGERAELHLALAAALEGLEASGQAVWSATAVAHHYHAAGEQPKALVAALTAASVVRGLHAYGEAAAMLDRALELWPRIEDPERVSGIDEAELISRAARVHYLAGEDGVAEALYRRAIEALGEGGDAERLASALTALATSQWSMGRSELSRETQRRGLALLEGRNDSPARAGLLAQQVRFLLLQGRFSEVCDAAPEAIEATTRLDLDSARAGVLNRYGCALFALGREQEGRRRMEESIEIAERTGFSDDLATAYLNYADSLHSVGHGAEARRVAEQGTERVEDRITLSAGGSTRSMRFLRLNLAEIHFDLGDWESAAKELSAAGPAVQGVGLAHARLLEAQLGLARGRDQEARVALEQADELLRDVLEPQYIALLAVLQARAEVRSGELDSARAAIDRGLDRIQFCSEDGARLALTAAEGISVEAEIAERARDLDDDQAAGAALARAESLCEIARVAAEEGGRPVECALLALAEAQSARVGGADEPALWERAAAGWQRVGRAYPEAIARWRQAQAALSRSDREAAVEALGRSAVIAERLGAIWLEREIDGLASRARLSLATAPAPADGEQPPADELPFGLTPRELQVLELVASGATNREIGERLYMAEKTASVHVSRILTKLGVRRRTEAAAVAHRHGIGSE